MSLAVTISYDVEIVEAMALRRGILVARYAGLVHLIIETDANMANLVNKVSSSLGEAGVIIDEIQNLLESIPKSGVVPRCIAKRAIANDGDFVWLKEAPRF